MRCLFLANVLNFETLQTNRGPSVHALESEAEARFNIEMLNAQLAEAQAARELAELRTNRALDDAVSSIISEAPKITTLRSGGKPEGTHSDKLTREKGEHRIIFPFLYFGQL